MCPQFKSTAHHKAWLIINLNCDEPHVSEKFTFHIDDLLWESIFLNLIFLQVKLLGQNFLLNALIVLHAIFYHKHATFKLSKRVCLHWESFSCFNDFPHIDESVCIDVQEVNLVKVVTCYEDIIVVKYAADLDSTRGRNIGYYRVELVSRTFTSKSTDHVWCETICILLAKRTNEWLPDYSAICLQIFFLLILLSFDLFSVLIFSILTGMYPCHIQIVHFYVILFALSQ